MTPCEKRGYKIGDLFRMVKPAAFSEGSIIRLVNDNDRDNAPYFELVHGTSRYGWDRRAVALHRVIKLSPEEAMTLFLTGYQE